MVGSMTGRSPFVALFAVAALLSIILFNVAVSLWTYENIRFGDTSNSPGHMQKPNPEHHQQRRSLILLPLLERLVPFFRPNQYWLQDVQAFLLFTVCTDIQRDGCDFSNTIRFVNTRNPAPNEFRYHDRGPYQMRGVFWTRQNFLDRQLDFFDLIARTHLVSFAESRHGEGVQTGQLQTDWNGYEYVVRPLGDHTWSTSPNAPNTYLSAYDALYLYDLVEGTLLNPLRFEIVPSAKFWFDCLRVNFGKTVANAVKFEQVLITDPNHPEQQKYPNSVVWLRRTTYLSVIRAEYTIVQVVDGSGNVIEPAWSEFQQEAEVIEVPGLKPDRLNDRQKCY